MYDCKSYFNGGEDTLLSVGIDIGTTSCHLVFSKLTLSRQSGATEIPRLSISSREVVFESPVYFTPVREDGTIDSAGVRELVAEQYRQSGYQPADIACGAVIITGETARIRNAREVLTQISSLAGDFVAASAGPALESLLAGRGSGAAQYSKESGKTICNVDIGGGTTNLAVFKAGESVETSCLRLGARCLRYSRTGRLTCVSESGRILLDDFSRQNSRAGEEPLELGCHAASLIIDFMTGDCARALPHGLVVESRSVADCEIDEYWLSGGVAQLIEEPGEDPFVFEDFGWALARGLAGGLSRRGVAYRISPRPIRATVLGAGSYSIQLSGNTVSVLTERLPLKSVPIVRPFGFGRLHASSAPDQSEVASAIRRSLSTITPSCEEGPVAIVFDSGPPSRYISLKCWARALATALEAEALSRPYIVVVGNDTAMALGQLLSGLMKEKDLVVLDGLDLSEGDFIDIGRPIGRGETIPVSVKTLVFANEH